MLVHDDMGTPLELPSAPSRVVSLVPSLTESVAASGLLVGATQWCTHPIGLDVRRVRGTKNPDLNAILELKPDLVLANKEENRQLDVRRLREHGVQVWVTIIEALPEALDSLDRMFTEALQLPIPDWLTTARSLWSGGPPPATSTVAVPIWRDPWMVVGSSTFTGDLLRRVGLRNAFADSPERYPHVEIEQVDRPEVDVVLLPDEPYRFTADDGPEAFRVAPTRLVSGRLITWYGPSLVAAHQELSRLAADASSSRTRSRPAHESP